jgi:hypothetical protein
MRSVLCGLLAIVLLPGSAGAAPKPRVISFGKWTTVKWFVGQDKPLDLKLRALYIDSQLKEFTIGTPHHVTDRLIVVHRAFRVNDALPEEMSPVPNWRWQRGGWLLVDRITGHISAINLPEFDSFYSIASWYRDYGAYCGVSDDGKNLYAMVTQLGRRKPILKKALGDAPGDNVPDSACPAPTWQRQPVRVTFSSPLDQKLTYSVRGHAVDVVNDEEEEGTK